MQNWTVSYDNRKLTMQTNTMYRLHGSNLWPKERWDRVSGETARRAELSECVYSAAGKALPCLWGIQRYTQFPVFFHWVQRTCAPMGDILYWAVIFTDYWGGLDNSQEITNNMVTVHLLSIFHCFFHIFQVSVLKDFCIS